ARILRNTRSGSAGFCGRTESDRRGASLGARLPGVNRGGPTGVASVASLSAAPLEGGAGSGPGTHGRATKGMAPPGKDRGRCPRLQCVLGGGQCLRLAVPRREGLFRRPFAAVLR